MLAEADVPGTDDWWAVRLATKLGERFERLGKLRAHYDGTIQVPDGASGPMREAYARFVNMGRLNMARLVVQAVTSRQVPTGFRTAATNDPTGDELAMATWRRSRMATQARDMFENLGVYGEAYGLVDEDGMIHALSPWMAITDSADGAVWGTDAGLTATFDPIEQAMVLTLFRPGYVRQAVIDAEVSTIPQDGRKWFPGRDWEWVSDPQPLGWTDRVPLVPLSSPGKMGQFEPHIDTLDRISHTIFQRLVIVAMQAFRQRAIKGDLPSHYPDDHPQRGQKIDYDKIFEAGPAALWMIPEGADIWESAVTDIASISTEVDKDVKRLAAASGTPLYMLSPDAADGSAEGAQLLRETLTFKVEDLNARVGESLADLLALSFAAQGETERADPAQIETIWMPADRSSWAERAQAASQAASTLPRRTIWRDIYQMTPSQITQAQAELDEEAFAEVLNGTGSDQ